MLNRKSLRPKARLKREWFMTNPAQQSTQTCSACRRTQNVGQDRSPVLSVYESPLLPKPTERRLSCATYDMTICFFRWVVLVAFASLIVACFSILEPIAQDPQYHRFADTRTMH